MCGRCLSRRGLLAALAAASLAGCSETAVTGRSQLGVVDEHQLAGFADQAWDEVVAKVPPVADPAAHTRLARIGAPLVKASGRDDLDWSFTVLDSPDLNAFVLPNGRVGFFRGLLELAGSDDEIASVLGHEIGHALGVGAALGVILPYSRKHELEADRVGVDLMRKAGKDPAAAIRFWERMVARSAQASRPPEVISTHPADAKRLAALKAAVATSLP